MILNAAQNVKQDRREGIGIPLAWHIRIVPRPVRDRDPVPDKRFRPYHRFGGMQRRRPWLLTA